MAIIGKIRENSGLTIILITLAMLGFVATDLLQNRLFSSDSGPKGVGAAFGKPLSVDAYRHEVDRELQNRRQQLKADEELTEDMETEAREAAWNRFTLMNLLESEGEKLGLSVSGIEIKELSFGSMTHSFAAQSFGGADGQFSQQEKQQINAAINNIASLDPNQQQAWAEYEQQFTVTRMFEKYNAMIGKSLFVTDLEAKQDFLDKNQSVSMQFVPYLLNTISDSAVKVTDAEIRAYYNDHLEDYKREEGRSFDYVIFPVLNSVADTMHVVQEMNKIAYNWRTSKNDASFATGNQGLFLNAISPRGTIPNPEIDSLLFSADSGQVVGPVKIGNKMVIAKVTATSKADSFIARRVSHIVIRPQGISAADSLTARRTADSLYTAIRSGKISFASAAMQRGEDASAQKGGDLGWVTSKTPMVQEFLDGVKKLNSNGDMAVVKTQFGYHIIRLTAPIVNRGVKGGYIEREFKPMSATVKAASEAAASFAQQAINSDEFDKAVKARNLVPRLSENVTPGQYTITGLNNGRQLVRWAYYNDTKVGDISQVMKAGDAFVVVRLRSKYSAGYAPFEDIKSSVTTFAIRKKKQEILAAKMKSAIEKSKIDLNEVAKIINSNVLNADNLTFASGSIPNMPNEPALVGYTFGTEPNKLAGPIIGNDGVYAIKILGFAPIVVPASLVNERKTMLSQKTQMAGNEAIEALIKKADLKDYRYNYDM